MPDKTYNDWLESSLWPTYVFSAYKQIHMGS